ncbi:hypothetical protein [Ottowia sp.]|uniref:hypothetical protein n=1 Tax=Ottowia sp. TaxID=1898956 RepID=UPI0039E6E1E6
MQANQDPVATPPLSRWANALRLRCPHCGLQALPAWRKIALGWDRPVACRACGLGVEVSSFRAMLATLPIVGGAFVLAVYGGLARGLPARPAIAALVLMALVSVLAYLFGVPLQRAGHTDADAVRRARRSAME